MGVLSQVPVLAVNVLPIRAVPDIAGNTVLTGYDGSGGSPTPIPVPIVIPDPMFIAIILRPLLYCRPEQHI